MSVSYIKLFFQFDIGMTAQWKQAVNHDNRDQENQESDLLHSERKHNEAEHFALAMSNTMMTIEFCTHCMADCALIHHANLLPSWT